MLDKILSPQFSDQLEAADWQPEVGDLVVNMGRYGARVVEVRPAPYSDLVLQAVGLDWPSDQLGMRWAADPAKCKPAI